MAETCSETTRKIIEQSRQIREQARQTVEQARILVRDVAEMWKRRQP